MKLICNAALIKKVPEWFEFAQLMGEGQDFSGSIVVFQCEGYNES